MKDALPKVLAQNGYRRAARYVFFTRYLAPHLGSNSQHPEVARRYARLEDILRSPWEAKLAPLVPE